ncbi:MAG TPA: ATP-binding protein [Acidimicrobiales bacterium]|nr:ATP-binding protein [Acidimicrobiales bacterium]
MSGRGGTRWERAYAPRDEQAAAARRDATRELSAHGLGPDALEDALIVVGELVTNAIRHAATEFTLALDIDAERVRIEVSDGDTRPPVVVAADVDATSGRGLVLVAAVASSWGFETADRDGITGKTVWAELLRADDADRAVG